MKRRGPSRVFPDGVCDVSYDGGMQELCMSPTNISVQGPSSLSQCFAWSRHFLSVLSKDDESLVRLINNVRGGLNIRTHYSGMDAPGEALRGIADALADAGHNVDPDRVINLSHSADIWPIAQKVLCTLPEGPTHVFGDLLDRWGSKVRHDLGVIETNVDAAFEAEKNKITSKERDPTKLNQRLRTLRAMV